MKEKEQEQIWNGFSQKKVQILYVVTRNLYQNVAAMWKSALIAKFGQN